MQENNNVSNVTTKKRGVSKEDLEIAFEIAEYDVPEVAQLLGKTVRHIYRLINKFELKDEFYKLKDDIATENSIGDLAKDITTEFLLDMKDTLRERKLAKERKKLNPDEDVFIPPTLSKQEVTFLIFVDKSKGNFIEAKLESGSGGEGGDDKPNEFQNAVASAVDQAKKEFLESGLISDDS